MLLEGLFFQIGIVLVIAALLSMIVFRLRQPLIIAYILTGIVVGPGILAITHDVEIFQVMSEIGVAFLLFTVGLGLNWRNIKDVGGIAAATGVGQVLFTSIVGFMIGLLLGFDAVTSVYLAVAFAFSSTIIIIKLLMDKEDLDSLYGRISVGFLLVQDFIAMLILLGLGAVSSGATLNEVLIGTAIKGVVLVPLLWFVSAKLVPPLLSYVARSQELLFIFAIAWCFLIAGFLVRLGFGVELGALIAGVTLSSSVYYREINARIRPLRDFFLVIFFIVLGTQLGFESFTSTIIPTVVFSLFVLIGNPIIVVLIMRSLGYHPRTGFLSGTTVAQISEFSFIVIVAGIAAGHLTDSDLALATAVGLITIAGSSFLIEHNERIYERIKWMFKWLEPSKMLNIEGKREHKASSVILFGYHRTGKVLLETIRKMKRTYTVVDFDPLIIRELAEMGESGVYGDAGDENFLEELKADKTRLIVSTIPDLVISISILGFLKSRDYKGVVIVSAHSQIEAEKCYKLGASYVIVPNVLSGKKFSEMLKKKKTAKKSWESLSKTM
ncbi:sodium:proton exchanger [Candidatus Uhrbacteria bacterium CG_4_9_14_3_um_filter_50_9]|uniref:Sodium:proton exchanger n=1 Tax=Candidatus Uhrbacteria bacterium CG_4_9_14_3_um_filter_50_9 TaxID=1975035 RepID=A0A2M7XBA9_9BACT|nr:MAG: sodium:proton exchanger [Candidatus Uhrbacteria bacterium CG_4_9_14_3_um_filter_50_9]